MQCITSIDVLHLLNLFNALHRSMFLVHHPWNLNREAFKSKLFKHCYLSYRKTFNLHILHGYSTVSSLIHHSPSETDVFLLTPQYVYFRNGRSVRSERNEHSLTPFFLVAPVVQSLWHQPLHNLPNPHQPSPPCLLCTIKLRVLLPNISASSIRWMPISLHLNSLSLKAHSRLAATHQLWATVR